MRPLGVVMRKDPSLPRLIFTVSSVASSGSASVIRQSWPPCSEIYMSPFGPGPTLVTAAVSSG